MATMMRGRAALMALAVAVPLGLVACTPSIPGVGGKSGAKSQARNGPAISLAITPATDAKNLPISTEIGTTVAGGKITEVTVADSGGAKVSGRLRDDGSSWVPDSPLRYGRTYTAKVTATADTGKTETKSTTFATMASRPSNEIRTISYLVNGNTYGVAMPVVVEFKPGIAAKDRAGVQKRMFVTTNPPQPGVWHWVADGTQAFYRAPEYWRPGTKITTRIALGGHPVGGGRYGDSDRRASVTIGSKTALEIDNKTKQLSLYQNDKLIKKVPVSLGKASTPSSSGKMVIMEKAASTVFDTLAELGPAEGYRVTVAWAQRLTWGGEFIHAAPWSVYDQGYRNVSHGCVNVSTENAAWLFHRTKVGDPVTVRGTEVKLAAGNGWTAWNMTWPEFIKGSALPVPPDLVPKPAASPHPSQPPAAAPSPSVRPSN